MNTYIATSRISSYFSLSCICLLTHLISFYGFQGKFICVLLFVRKAPTETQNSRKRNPPKKKVLCFSTHVIWMTPEYETLIASILVLSFLFLLVYPQNALGSTCWPSLFPVVPTALRTHMLFMCLWKRLSGPVFKCLPSAPYWVKTCPRLRNIPPSLFKNVQKGIYPSC